MMVGTVKTYNANGAYGVVIANGMSYIFYVEKGGYVPAVGASVNFEKIDSARCSQAKVINPAN